MSKSLKRFEGYFLLDHRESPGNALAPEGTIFESEIVICSHCHRGVVLRKDRTRPRGYCPGCDRYVCDLCEGARATTGCTNLERVFAELAEKEIKQDALQKLRIL
jgi:hypothetical protein